MARLPLPAPDRRLKRAMEVVHEDATLHDTPSPRARLVSRAARLTAKPLLNVVPVSTRTINRLRRLEHRMPARSNPRVETEEIDLAGVPAEVQRPAEGVTSDLTIVYFHGGGFFSGSVASHRALTTRLALEADATVISVEYRQLPDADLAASVDDAITAYEAALAVVENTDRVVVGGDSAGGYLASKVVELANRRGLVVPAGLIGFSPLLSVDPERTDKNVMQVSRVRDAYLPRRRVGRIRTLWLPGDSMIEGFASPLHASAYITCPVHFVAVEDEFLRPEIEALTVLLTEKGVDVDLHIWRGLVHAFPVMADVMPEALEATKLAAAFARRVVGLEPIEEVLEEDFEEDFEEPADEALDAPIEQAR